MTTKYSQSSQKCKRLKKKKKSTVHAIDTPRSDVIKFL